MTFGFLLILLAAAMNGAFAIPMKFLSRWKWENTWLVWSILSLWLLPLVLLWIFVPHPIAAYQQTPWTTLALIAVVGLAWGTGVLLFGESFPHVGVAVGTAVGLGCASAVGAILPVLSGRASSLPFDSALGISLGIATAVIGVAMCGVAGRAREKRQGIEVSGAGNAMKGFLFAGVGGSITGVLNLAFAISAPIQDAVTRQHPTSSFASIAVWIPVLVAGGIPGIAYTIFLMRRNRSGHLFAVRGTALYWPLSLIMAILWLGSVIFYGNGADRIGALGPIVGWPVFMSGAVVAGAVLGTIFGEWKGSGRVAKLAMTFGVLCLVIAITIFGRASQ